MTPSNFYPKHGADLSPAMVWAHAIPIIKEVVGYWGDVVITSGLDSHETGLHPKEYAVDIRIWYIPEAVRERVRVILAERLGPAFDVLYETDPEHYHVEYDPW
jgi:hypothetical protein